MSDNTIELDLGTTAQKTTDGEKMPVVLLALDQVKYDMTRSLEELRALADANGMDAVAEVVQKRATPEAATLLGEGKVADAGDAQAAEQLAVTDEVLGSLDCEGIPQLVVYNKCDMANAVAFDPDILLTSAKTGYGLDALLDKIDDVLGHRVRTIELVLPYDKLALADILRSRGSVAAEEYREDGVFYRATVKIDDLHRFEAYLV